MAPIPGCLLLYHTLTAFRVNKATGVAVRLTRSRHQFQLVVGMLLSDGHAELHGNGVRISFQQEKSNLDYFLLVNKLLYKLGYVSTMEFEPNYRSNYCDIVGAVRHRIIYRLRTFSFGSLIWLRDLFYADGIKIVRPELEQYLTPLVLAHFICGDGSWAGYGVVLHVNSFTLEHTQLLAHMLSSKFGLVCSVISIRPNGYILCVPTVCLVGT
jgi:hypothetical protein